MKEKIHPNLNVICIADVLTGDRFMIRSTVKSRETELIDGKEVFILRKDVTSASHPAYTGVKRIVDTAGKVEKFNKRFQGRAGK
jgi:large subunit ribosomal protein L31